MSLFYVKCLYYCIISDVCNLCFARKFKQKRILSFENKVSWKIFLNSLMEYINKKCTSVSKSKVKKLTSAAQAELCIFSFQNMLYLYLFVNKKSPNNQTRTLEKFLSFISRVFNSGTFSLCTLN